jgi:hypothetical protein
MARLRRGDAPTENDRDEAEYEVENSVLGGADPMAAPLMGDGAPAEVDAPKEDGSYKADDEVENSVGDGPEKTLTKKIAIAACIPW